jgi:ATP-dependent Lhr-like helicase
MSTKAVTLSPTVARAFYGPHGWLRDAQERAVAPILSGHDVLVRAGTGSGKTEAAVAPLVQRLLGEQGGQPRLLYLSPTKALANDLHRRLRPPLEVLHLEVGIRHGERDDLRSARQPDVLVTTPESLDVLLCRSDAWLPAVHAVVLDELHLLYNTQRGFQTAILLRRLEQALQRELQAVGLSATIGDPCQVWSFFRPGRAVTVVDELAARRIDGVVKVEMTVGRLGRLLDGLAPKGPDKVLIFVNARRICDNLAAGLRDSGSFRGRVFAHHGSLSKRVRLAVERAFQEPRPAICIATSTLELGIDIGDIDLVVLWGQPSGWQSFLQRIGRGNRRRGHSNVLCVVPDDAPAFLGALCFETLLAQVRDRRLGTAAPYELYGAAAQQVLSAVASRDGRYVRVRDLCELFAPWPQLDRGSVERVLAALADRGFLRKHPAQERYGPAEQLYRLRDWRILWTNFPLGSEEIRVVSQEGELGTIPATNLLRLRPGGVLRFAGRNWEVRHVEPDHVRVAPTRAPADTDIVFGGSPAPIDPLTIEEMLRVARDATEFQIGPQRELDRFRRLLTRLRPHLRDGALPYARTRSGYVYLTFGGRLLNRVLARWSGHDVKATSELALWTARAIDLGPLPDQPRQLAETAADVLDVPADLTAYQQLLPTDLLRRELLESWLKDQSYRRSLQRLRAAPLVEVPVQDIAALLEPSAGTTVRRDGPR